MGTVAFAEPGGGWQPEDWCLADGVALTDVVTIYPPEYDVLGAVAKPGDDLFIPILSGSQAGGQVIGWGPNAVAADRVYGTDVGLSTAGLLSLDAEGRLVEAAGIPNLLQAISHRFAVARGSYINHPRYGNGLEAMCGMAPRRCPTPW